MGMGWAWAFGCVRVIMVVGTHKNTEATAEATAEAACARAMCNCLMYLACHSMCRQDPGSRGQQWQRQIDRGGAD